MDHGSKGEKENEAGQAALESVPVTQPIFNAGRSRLNIKVAEAQQQAYKQSIEQAFRQVSDALVVTFSFRDSGSKLCSRGIRLIDTGRSDVVT